MEFGYEYFQKTRGAGEAILIQLLTTLLYPAKDKFKIILKES